MTDLVSIKMTTNLLHRSRMNGFILPEIDGVVEVDPDSAERLIAAGQAESVETVEAEADSGAAGGDEASEAPAGETSAPVDEAAEAPAKRGPGRPRKNP